MSLAQLLFYAGYSEYLKTIISNRGAKRSITRSQVSIQSTSSKLTVDD